MLATGRYLWNSGMFLFRACDILAAFDAHAPEITAACATGIFLTIKATMGLRVSAEEEIEGLDYGEHGMHAYDLALGGASFESPVQGVPVAAATPAAALATEQG